MINYRLHIESDPLKMLGKPCIKGTRITVELILRKLSEGYSNNDIIESYPSLSNEMIQSCTAYAADMLSNETLLSASHF